MNKNWYAVLTADVLYDKKLSNTQKILVAIIANLSNEKGYCFASNNYLADMLNCSKVNIQQNITALVKAGYLNRILKLRPNGDIEYRALTPIHIADTKVELEGEPPPSENGHPIQELPHPQLKTTLPPVENYTTPYIENNTYNNKCINNKVNNKVNTVAEIKISATSEPFENKKNVFSSKNKIPPETDFLQFCKDLLKENFLPLEFSLKAKFEAWTSDGWKDGNGMKIKNWKSKIKNTIPYLKPFQHGQLRSPTTPINSSQWDESKPRIPV